MYKQGESTAPTWLSSAVEEDWPVLAGAARGGMGSKGGGVLVMSSDVDTRELAGF